MPYGKSFSKKYYCFVLLFFITCSSVGGAYLLSHSQLLFWLLMLLISVVLGFFEANIDQLKTLSSWVFIGILYGSYELQTFSLTISTFQYLLIIFTSLLTTILFVQLTKVDFSNYQFKVRLDYREIIHYLKYTFYLLIALVIFIVLPMKEPQWYFWSGLSVLSLNIGNAVNKIKLRAISGAVGIFLGMFVIHFLSESLFLMIISYIGIVLSLMAFKQYIYNFSIRCFFIVLFAGSQAMSVAQIRIIDVIIGGLIGLVMSISLSLLYKKSHN
ncbi:FUSC family protein [Thiotrichales bacterium 19S11-10]|nr:FUSC family protein [Thiotrichales bacterium 19S11-10]